MQRRSRNCCGNGVFLSAVASGKLTDAIRPIKESRVFHEMGSSCRDVDEETVRLLIVHNTCV